MPQSLVKNYVHIVYGTRHRIPLITTEISGELYSYLAGICKEMECHPLVVGGHVDHIHMLCMLSRKVALMDLLEETKAHSSKWIKTKGNKFNNFYWQGGYGAFSVSPKEVQRVTEYILNQEAHHKKKTFDEEFIEFLDEYGVEYDLRYLWD